MLENELYCYHIYIICVANLPDEAVRPLSAATTTGVYYGFAQVRPSNIEGKSNDLSQEDSGVYPMAMSLGWNPFYKNERLSAVSCNGYQYDL